MNTTEPLESPLWEREAVYDYYDHGPMARVEMGQRQVQGMDYAYTLQGWIKAVNSSTLTIEKDMGRDGAPNSYLPGTNQNRHKNVARDAFSYSLGYFDGDFSPIGGQSGEFELDASSSPFNGNASLYNGNIRQMVSESMGLTGGASGAQYTYDQLHRIKSMNSYHIIGDPANYQWGSQLTASGNSSHYTYDPNGNITFLEREAEGQVMDDLIYDYDPLHPNRLTSVNDNTAENLFPNDFDAQAAGNYSYDGSGNMTQDQQSQSTLSWTPYGKVERIDFTGGRETIFEYGPDQNRITKNYLDLDENTIKINYYIRDAQGNVMAVYEEANGHIEWKEQHLYGSSRLGLWSPAVTWQTGTPPVDDPYYNTHPTQQGQKTYELSNHLGNVTATISDRKTFVDNDNDFIIDYYQPVLRSASEYYPFGLEIQDRSSNFGEYRFAFNGKEKDDKEEWGESTVYDYGFRIYNPSIARFLSVDPLSPDYPWYTPYQFAGNKPIANIDIDGLEEIGYLVSRKRAILGQSQLQNPSEWLGEDRLFIGPHTEKRFDPSNSFWKASIHNSISGGARYYNNIKKRHDFYLFAQDYIDWRGLSSGSKWFLAAAIVTQVHGVGGAQHNDLGIFTSNEADQFLTKGNTYLFEHNINNFKLLIEGFLDYSFIDVSGEVINFEGLDGIELDYALVKYEQSLVQDVIESYSGDINKIGEEINNLFNLSIAPSEIKAVMEEHFTDDEGNLTFDFLKYEDRVELGQRIIDGLYETS